MPTNEERREAVKRLREDARLGALPFIDFLGAVAYDVAVERDERGVLNRLADLIEPEPERTGTPVLDDQGWRMWRCPECGQSINRADNYCSSCGVKVTPNP